MARDGVEKGTAGVNDTAGNKDFKVSVSESKIRCERYSGTSPGFLQ